MFIYNKKFSLLLIIFSCSILVYTYFRSEIHWSGHKRNFYIIYYYISISLIFLSALFYFLNKNIKTYFIIIFGSSVITLYLFQAYLEFYLPKIELKKKIEIFNKENNKKEYDTRTRLQVFKDKKKNNNKIKVSIWPAANVSKDIDIFPLSGISNAVTINCNENGYYSIYESDRYGFNNPDQEWNQKNIEYLLVGDSFTHGACVNRPYDIASVLRKLSKKSVLNLGYSSNSSLIEYATLREYLNKNVKKVLWLYFEGNDLWELEKEIKNKILKKYLDDSLFSQNLIAKQNIIDHNLNIYLESFLQNENSEFELNFNFLEFIKLYKLRNLLQTQPESHQNFKKILSSAKKLISNNGSELFFVYLPDYYRYKKKNYDNFNYIKIKEIINELDIPFIDIHIDVFAKESDPLKLFPFERHAHYNILGFNKVANSIFKHSSNN